MGDFLLNSGILILQLRNYPGYIALVEQLSDQGVLFISTMTRFEILQGMKEPERKKTFETLGVLESLPVVDDIADKAGELVRNWRAKGVTLGISDVLIAATAIRHNLPLVTTNPKHFPMPELIVFASDDSGKMAKWNP